MLEGENCVGFEWGIGLGCDSCRLSRIFWNRPRLTWPGFMVLGMSLSDTKLPTRKAFVITSASWLA